MAFGVCFFSFFKRNCYSFLKQMQPLIFPPIMHESSSCSTSLLVLSVVILVSAGGITSPCASLLVTHLLFVKCLCKSCIRSSSCVVFITEQEFSVHCGYQSSVKFMFHKYFLPVISCLFLFLMVSFDEKFLISTKSNLSIFFFYGYGFQ